MCRCMNPRRGRNGCFANFRAPFCNRSTPRTKRHLENDLSAYENISITYCIPCEPCKCEKTKCDSPRSGQTYRSVDEFVHSFSEAEHNSCF